MSRVDQEGENGCWNWTGFLNSARGDYGQVRVNGKLYAAHRYSYEIAVGSIPEGLDLDHLCRNHRCVNPAHLDPVERRENLLRGHTVTARNAAVTHCPAGHPYGADNTYVTKAGSRTCRRCTYTKNAQRRARRRSAT